MRKRGREFLSGIYSSLCKMGAKRNIDYICEEKDQMKYSRKFLSTMHSSLCKIGAKKRIEYTNEERDIIEKWKGFYDKDGLNAMHLLIYHIIAEEERRAKSANSFFHELTRGTLQCFYPFIDESVSLLNKPDKSGELPLEKLFSYNFFDKQLIIVSIQLLFEALRFGADISLLVKKEKHQSYFSFLKEGIKDIDHGEKIKIHLIGSAIIGTLITNFKICEKARVVFSVMEFETTEKEREYIASKDEATLKRLDYKKSICSTIELNFETQIVIQVREKIDKLKSLFLEGVSDQFDPIKYAASLEYDEAEFGNCCYENIIIFLTWYYSWDKVDFNIRLKKVLPIIAKELLANQTEAQKKNDMVLQLEFIKSCGRYGTALTEILVKEGAKVNESAYSDKEPPLFHLLCCQNIDTLRVLLEAGADPNKKVFGCSVLYEAAKYDYTGKIAKLLIEYGADLKCESETLRSALLFENKNFAKVLYKNGVRLRESCTELSALALKTLKEVKEESEKEAMRHR